MALIELEGFRTRLRKLIDEYFEGRAVKFSKHTGIENSAVSRWLSGINTPTKSNLVLLRNSGINDVWLLTGVGDMFINDAVKEPSQNYIANAKKISLPDDTYIRLVSVPANAGKSYNFDDIAETMMLVTRRYSSKKNIAFRVSGDSMQPTLMNNCIVIVDTEREPTDDDIIVCQLNNELLCKRLEIKSDRLLLRSDNKQYPDITINSLDECKVVGVVVHAEINFY